MLPFLITFWYLWLFFRKKKRGEYLPLYPIIILLIPILFTLSWFVLLFGNLLNLFNYIEESLFFPRGFLEDIYSEWIPPIFLWGTPVIALTFLILNVIKRRRLPIIILSIAFIFSSFFALLLFPIGSRISYLWESIKGPPQFEALDSEMSKLALNYPDSLVLKQYVMKRAKVYNEIYNYYTVRGQRPRPPIVSYYPGYALFWREECSNDKEEAKLWALSSYGNEQDAKVVNEIIDEKYFEFKINAIDTRFNYKPREDHINRVHRCDYIKFLPHNDVSISLYKTDSSALGYFQKKPFTRESANELFSYIAKNAFGLDLTEIFSTILGSEFSELDSNYQLRIVFFVLSDGGALVKSDIFLLDKTTGEVSYKQIEHQKIAINEEKIIKKISNSCKLVVDKKALSNVQSCTENEYTLEDGANVVYVSIIYGPPRDCPAGCFYMSYTGVIENGVVYDFFWDTRGAIHVLDRYGSFCSSSDFLEEPSKNTSFTKTIVRSDEPFRYQWKYVFNNSRPTQSSFCDAKECPNLKKVLPICLLNGELLVYNDGIANADDSKLQRIFEYAPTEDICKDVKLNLKEQNLCFYSLGVITENLAYCREDGCKSTIALKKKDPSICVFVTQDYLRDRCYRYIAESERNTKLCQLIPGSFEREQCIESTQKNLGIFEK